MTGEEPTLEQTSVEATIRRRDFLKVSAFALGAVSFGSLLAACGDDSDDEDPTPEPDSEATEAPEGAATAEGSDDGEDDESEDTPSGDDAERSGGEIVIAQGSEAETLDAQATISAPALNIVSNVSETLVRVSIPESGSYELEPVLAESWESVDDTTWQFVLRQDVTFSNGEPFNAEVVRYSVERIQQNEFPVLSYLTGVTEVEIVDDYTVNILTDSPQPLVPSNFNIIYMVPPEYAEEVGTEGFATSPIGTGPYKFVEWIRDDHALLEANEDYWGDMPSFDSVRYVPIPEASTRTAALINGQVDFVMPLSIADIPQVESQDGVSVGTSSSPRVMFIALDNVQHEALSNRLVREALNYAVDKEAIVDNLLQGHAGVLQGQILTPVYFGFNPDLEAFPYDPDRARELLAEAGYADGFSATLLSSRARYPMDDATSEAVAGQLREVGVDVTVEALDFAVYFEGLGNPDAAPMQLKGIATNFPDGVPMFRHFTSDGPLSIANNPELDELWQQASETVDSEEREDLLQQVGQVIHDEALAIFLHNLHVIYGISDRVQGITVSSNDVIDLRSASIVEG